MYTSRSLLSSDILEAFPTNNKVILYTRYIFKVSVQVSHGRI